MENLITDIDIVDESKNCFLDYAEEVLTDRAIPSAEDGLLSVHRKILWTMENVLKMSSKSKYKKSASIVGSTLAAAYFHGDTSCYGALCKLSQEYLMRYPLIDGKGNLGTQEGNGMEAAMRYSNAKPSKYADLMYEDYNKNVVPLKPTYNEEYMEPVVLPSIFPNAICNGREAIGIGFSHNSLPHNLTEVINAIIKYLKNNNITTEEIIEEMPGPDFPLGGTVVNTQDVVTAYKTGHSVTSLKVRGDYEIKGQNIIFTSIPYRTYRNKIKEQIEKNIDVLEKYIDDFSDESNVGVNRLVFHCIKGVNPESAVEVLFNCTDLQTTLSYNMNFIVDGTPKLCSMKTLIKAYADHQFRVLVAAAKFDKDKAEARKHVLDGLLIALGDIDKAIELIKASDNKDKAVIALTNYFAIDTEQAQAILNMKLSRLTKLNSEDLRKELKEKIALIKECSKIIEDEKHRTEVLIAKLKTLCSKYGDKRKTKLLYQTIEKKTKSTPEKKIVPEDCVVMMMQDGTIKRVSRSSVKIQRRNGKGLKTKDKAILSAVSTNTTDDIMLFSNKGKMYRLSVNDISAGTAASKGIFINTFIKLDSDERIMTISSFNKQSLSEYVMFTTKNGTVKKTKITEYTSTKAKKGIIAIKLRDGDSLQSIDFINGEDMILVTKGGKAIRFNSSLVSSSGRNSIGVKGISLDEGDYVVSALTIEKEGTQIVVFVTDGYGHKFDCNNLQVQSRGGKGVKVAEDSEVVGAFTVTNDDSVLLIGKPNSIGVSIKDIPLSHRLAKGVTMIKGSVVTSCIKL